MPQPTTARRPSPYVAVDGTAIRRRRIDRGETLSELAERLGISQPYMSQIELSSTDGSGRRVSPAVFRRLCDELGMEPDELRIED